MRVTRRFYDNVGRKAPLIGGNFMNIRQRYREYKIRCIVYNWYYLDFREWYTVYAIIEQGARLQVKTVWVVTSPGNYYDGDGSAVLAVYSRKPTEFEEGGNDIEEFELTY